MIPLAKASRDDARDFTAFDLEVVALGLDQQNATNIMKAARSWRCAEHPEEVLTLIRCGKEAIGFVLRCPVCHRQLIFMPEP